jgi:transcriptional regulator with XRE-family HTH domain
MSHCIYIGAMIKTIYSQESDFLRQWLIEKRHEVKLSQRELSDLLQINNSVVAKIETGERQLKVVELIQYCKVLDADPLEIIALLNDLKS